MPKINFAFFGGEPLSVPTLRKLHENGFVPALVISNPDKPRGRNLEITPPPTALWAKQQNIQLIQPEKLSKGEIQGDFDFFVVVSYGKIIPKEILDLPKYGAINIHPSLLPRYRGPSPIVSTILNGDKETGVTVIKIDEEMDHGPILAQEKIPLSGNESLQDLEKSLAKLGGELLVKIIPEFIAGKIKPKEQDHSAAICVKKITKADGEIDPRGDPVKNWRKFRAYAPWPRTFFFKNGKRIIVTDAVFENNQFIIKKVLPEGKKEITWEEFQKISISK
ncbi:methionyl-tRNA formyltransferase [Candidatus Nomurabacteria bacterium RIFCSPLOWO2_01_FULL_39_18]|uniref:methionyl-tRNA formyltransferase n=1 Tax=Candidatus Nomurabacteria bacterium RIFCSPHIGHO2_01_FULL_40_24b TaxID=1801739 RepID=A0A1F6V6N5_9BACT|nr:MAG: methionyl-tRNA formyltransferase [Candidatus Nomurabacteria bacterium RIFCSPHIGHO2_01_FULL_40_24b]OGI89323.1 MAG: methionyl-tRNA formyltransferase [Candidatus Nomurabacteria bacterium RIFCSPLOWO2_01_FULL_39_18]